MGHLFISYSRADKKKVGKLVTQLEKAGHDVWLDTQDIEGGDQWRQAIVSAIKSGHALIVAISPRSVSSKNVRKELDVAEGASVRIIPVRLQAAAVPDALEYQLAGTQVIDLSKDFGGGVSRLLKVVGEDTRVSREAGGRRKRRHLLWALGGALAGAAIGFVLEPVSPVAGLITGAMLGAFSSFLLRLIGWISMLIGLLAVLLAGAVAGTWVNWLMAGRPETLTADEFVSVYPVAGVIAALLVVLLFKRWRKARKRAKLEALAKAA